MDRVKFAGSNPYIPAPEGMGRRKFIQIGTKAAAAAVTAPFVLPLKAFAQTTATKTVQDRPRIIFNPALETSIGPQDLDPAAATEVFRNVVEHPPSSSTILHWPEAAKKPFQGQFITDFVRTPEKFANLLPADADSATTLTWRGGRPTIRSMVFVDRATLFPDGTRRELFEASSRLIAAAGREVYGNATDFLKEIESKGVSNVAARGPQLKLPSYKAGLDFLETFSQAPDFTNHMVGIQQGILDALERESDKVFPMIKTLT